MPPVDMTPEAFARYLVREVELARSNVEVQMVKIRALVKAGRITLERSVDGHGRERVGSPDVVLCTLASHRTLMLAAAVE